MKNLLNLRQDDALPWRFGKMADANEFNPRAFNSESGLGPTSKCKKTVDAEKEPRNLILKGFGADYLKGRYVI